MSYYVYALYNSEKPGVPFYVGKGKKGRASSHVRLAKKDDGPRASYIRNILARGGSVIHKKLIEGLTEERAFEEERKFIAIRRTKALKKRIGS